MLGEKVKTITHIYYSKPAVQQALFDFGKQREVVPRYVESFGKRPDTLQYPADVFSLVQKGATSFHASEELWRDPLEIQTEMSAPELTDLRIAWDLLIDIDSSYLDYSKIAARLIIESLERNGISSYGIKFSGSKGFHIIVPAAAFPEIFQGQETKKMFPEWPRAICEYLLAEIRSKYNKAIGELNVNFKAVEERLNLKKEDVLEILCPRCGSKSKKGTISVLVCPRCKSRVERRDLKKSARKLKCIEPSCPGFYDLIEEKEYFLCANCGHSDISKLQDSSNKVVYARGLSQTAPEEFKEELIASKLGSLDLVLVSPRHLFRMPYSLHEKTALASIVLTKDQLASFEPKDADPFKVNVIPFYPKPQRVEAESLLTSALAWKRLHEKVETSRKYDPEQYKDVEITGVTEDMFPKPIKKLLKGLKDGRKRGLFILITFLKSLNFSNAYVEETVYNWNKKNEPPIKDGYIKSQLDWHFKQKRKILPPNYSNESFYKDLQLLDGQPDAKNPIVEVLRIIRKSHS